MSNSPHRNHRTRRRIIDNERHAFFVTFSCYRRRKLLDDDRAKGIVVHYLSAQLKHQSGACMGFVIMPDHVHAMVRFQQPGSLSVFMGQWKRRSSLELKNLFQTKLTGYGAKIDLHGPMWQPKYHVFNVHSPAKAKEKLTYMHNNPVTAGMVKRAEDWRFSSAGWYVLNRSVGVDLTPLK
jgi:putative transposase